MKGKTFTSFGLKILIFILILFGIDRVMGSVFTAIKDHVLRNNPENIALRTPFIVEKADADLLIIGSSKACHHYVSKMMEDTLGITVYNCGQDGCYFLYQNAIVNMVLDRYKPEVIIWDIQPNAFNSAKEIDEYVHFRNLSPYYYEDNQWVQTYIDESSSTMPLKMFSEMYAYNSMLTSYLFPLFLKKKTLSGYVPLPNEGYIFPQLREEMKDEYIPDNDKLEKLSQTVKRCNTSGIKLYLVVSPTYAYKPVSFQSILQDLSHIANDNDTGFYDFSSDSGFLNDSTLFKDNAHLNDKGARKFTQYILDIL